MDQRLVDVINEVFPAEHYAYRTEETYLYWIKRYISFHGNRHPRDLGADEIRQFLSNLAVQFKVSASTQNQALSAILFLYKKVLGVELPWLDNVVRARRPKRVPIVLTRDDVSRVLGCMHALRQRLAHGGVPSPVHPGHRFRVPAIDDSGWHHSHASGLSL